MTDDPRFLACLPFTLQEEGGKTDDPHDPGGRTNLGIIQTEYDAWRVTQHLPKRDVYLIETSEMQAIYQTQYWLPHCPQFFPGFDLCFFDTDVNTGVVEAAKLLQRALGVAVDGHIGLVTMGALATVTDRTALINRFCDLRLGFYRSLVRLFRYFGADWKGREERCRTLALKMVTT